MRAIRIVHRYPHSLYNLSCQYTPTQLLRVLELIPWFGLGKDVSPTMCSQNCDSVDNRCRCDGVAKIHLLLSSVRRLSGNPILIRPTPL